MTYETEYEVRWDGTRQRGAYLFCEAEVPQEAPRPTGSDSARRGLRGRVVEQLAHGPESMRGLAAALGVDIHAVNGALFALGNEKVVRVRGSQWNPRRCQRENSYRLVDC
jgi:hypothetical protein